MKEFAASEWGRARRTLGTAEKLIEMDPDSAASRAYYAAYHAVTALFALRGTTFTKHTAIRAAIHRDLVKTGEWNPSLGKDFDFLMELREIGDYGGVLQVTVADAQSAIKCSSRIVAEVQLSCSTLVG